MIVVWPTAQSSKGSCSTGTHDPSRRSSARVRQGKVVVSCPRRNARREAFLCGTGSTACRLNPDLGRVWVRTALRQAKGWASPELIAVLLMTSLVVFSAGNISPILPLYVQGFGVAPQDIGFMASVMILAVAISEVTWGWLIDRVDLKLAMLVGSIPLALAIGSFHFARTTAMFYVSFFLFGLFRPSVFVAGRWYMGVHSPPARRALALAVIAAAASLNQSLSGFTSGFMTDRWGYPATIGASAAVALIAGLVLVLNFRKLDFRKRSHVDPVTKRMPDSGPPSGGKVYGYVLLLGLAAAAFFTSQGIVFTFLPLFATQVAGTDAAGVGILFGVRGLVHGITLMPMGALADRKGKKLFLPLGLLTVALSMVGIAVSSGMSMLLLSIMLFAVGGSLIMPTGVALLSEKVPLNQQGTAIGIFGLLEDAGWMVGTALGGSLWGSAGPSSPFYLAAIVAVIGSILYWLVFLARPARRSADTMHGPRIG